VEELVQNAFKFSSANTPVVVKLTETGSAATLSVSDTGRGFSTEHINKVGAYMQFDRKLHEQQGLGLGLTIVRRLSEIHGGTLTIQSEKGTGTTVSIKFPRAVATPAGEMAGGLASAAR
jgi:signal transduction histidine kinase